MLREEMRGHGLVGTAGGYGGGSDGLSVCLCLFMGVMAVLSMATCSAGLKENTGIKAEAVRRGYAEWKVDADGNGSTFMWKEPSSK